MGEVLSARRCQNRARRGTATVEFAVVALPLLILLLGAVDVGQYINTSQAVTNAAREAARRAAQRTTRSETDVRAAALDYLDHCFPRVGRENLDAALSVSVNAWKRGDFDNNPWTFDTTQPASLANASTGQPVEVEVGLAFNSVRWLHGPGFAADRTFAATTVMRRE
jgi:Flp pilus assembly protein TadG